MNVERYLLDHLVPFDVIPHRPTFDAQRLAQAVQTPGREVAKTVLLRAGGGYRYLLAVIPATCRVDFRKLADLVGGDKVELATEEELIRHCPDCEPGVLPPFGSQYAVKTLLDEQLLGDEMDDGKIVFEGNRHDHAIRMRVKDYLKIEHPLISAIAS